MCTYVVTKCIYTRKGLEFLIIVTFSLPGEFPEEDNIKKTPQGVI